MRILHISKYYSPIVGGIEDVCYNVVSLLNDRCEQYVLSINDRRITEESVVNGVKVMRCGRLGVIASQPISVDMFFQLKKILKSFKPDIVTLHLPNPLACMYLLQLLDKHTKLILHWHSDIVAQRLLYSMIKPIEDRILARADSIIVTSPPYLEHSRVLAPYKDKCVILPNIISQEKMGMVSVEKVEKIKKRYKNKPIVFFLGRHVEYKGLKYLVEAAKYIKTDCVILIAGSGPLTETLKELSKDERIVFIGRIKDEEIASYMTAADVFAFPSITKNEAFGVVLAEAMFCKTVPVTFTIPCSGVNWVSVNGETGLQVDNGDSAAFGYAVDSLLINEERRKALANNAYDRVQLLFTSDAIKEALYLIYQ